MSPAVSDVEQSHVDSDEEESLVFSYVELFHVVSDIEQP